MKKRFYSVVLAVLMVLNMLPISVLAEGLEQEDVHSDIKAELMSNAEEVCTHTNVVKYVVTEQICQDDCAYPKGTGELYLCMDCEELAWCGSWGGGTYSPQEVTFDKQNQTVKLSCEFCSAEKTFSLNDEHIHAWDDGTVVAPTCTEQGYTKYTCTSCGAERVDNYVSPLGHHTWDDGTVVAPTCTEQGYTKYTCTDCDAERVDNYMPALGHNWDNGVVTAEPNCSQTGVKTYTCKTCNDTKTETLGVKDMHLLTSEETSATCEEDGYTKYTCSLCGYSYTVPIPSGHEWEEISRTDATCVAQGAVNYVCSVCHQTKQDTLPATGKHTWEEISNTATCEEDGYISYECRDCDATRTTDAAALGHSWGEWTVDTAPTCKAAGVEKRVCERGCLKTRVMPAVSHNYGQDYKCIYCGETYPVVQAIVDAIAALPAADKINERNALAFYNEVTDIIDRMNQIEDGTNSDHKAALELYANQDTVHEVYEECLKYLIFTVYEKEVGEQTFEAFWNDNNERDYRTPMDQFLAASHAVLGYEIVSEDGSTVVASGVLTNAADVNAAFAFLNINMSENENLLTTKLEAESYLIETNPKLPVGYKSTYTDYTTGESYTSEFKINYTLTLENPAEAHYVTTLPERTTGAVTMKDGEMVIFTKLTDWSASIVWYDDDNRSALGGASTEHRPRVDTETLKAATKVYYYPQGYNVRDGEPVVGDFGYVIDGDTITLTGLPAYDNNGSPLAYYISQKDIAAANADYVSGNRYIVDYTNVGNFSAKTNGVYDGGYLFETLCNTVPFTVTKVWADGRTPDERPDCKFYIWRITEDYDGNQLAIDPEFCYAIPNCYDYYGVPKEDTNTYEFIRDMGGEQYLHLFPMYDTEGRRYIYFGKESGLPVEYSSILDNSGAKALDSVIAAFSQGTNAGYFLNGATITNTVGERTPMPVSKDFKALSIQNKLETDTPITATFLLQKKTADGSWVSADVDHDGIAYNEADGVIINKGSDGSLTVTLTKFAAEAMNASYGGVYVNQYDRDTHTAQEFRWVETGVSVNGVSAAYQPSDWVSDGNGIMRYEGDIIVNDGQTSTVLGDNTTKTSGADDTTAIFNAIASGSHFTNILIGKYQVEIRKYFVDENGNNIAADPQKMAGVSVTFTIYRDDVEFDTVTMTIDDLSRGNDYWEKLLNYNRYDEEGREYHFKVKETAYNDRWTNRSEDYEVQVLEYPAGSDILVKRLLTVYVNGPDPGGLEFDVEKQWLDDSDLQTRNPVVAAVYRFRDADGNLLSRPVQVGGDVTLSMSNNWFKKITVPAVNSDTNTDTTENYVILEKGILVDGTLVPTNYDFDLTSQALKDMHDAFVGGQTYAGITGRTEDEDGRWDGLYYRYKLFERRADRNETPALASYVLTNLRIGTQDYIVEKTWKAGGEIRKCSFGLFYKDQMIAEFTLDVVNDCAQLSNVDWKNGYDHSSIDIEATSAGIDNNGNYEASVEISGLPKFDDVGAQQEYSIQEIAIYGKNGTRYAVENGGCRAGDETYAVSEGTSLERADNDNHRAPDLYTVKVTNTLVGSYDLVSNKIWRDANQVVRPDVCFSVYRMSTQDDTLRELVASGDTVAMSAYLAAHTGSDYRVVTDRYWDTHINNYWWICTVENMQQYDSNGYPYVYYAEENLSNTHVGEGSADSMSTSALYVGYYCNYTAGQTGYRPTNPTDVPGSELTTKQVFGVENDELCSIDGNVFILADGVHKAANGEYKDYYSATAVNRPERERTVSGKKLWKLPRGWSVAETEMPDVKIDLYRTLNEISFSDYNTPIEYANAIKTAAAAEGGILNTVVANNDCKYVYSFTADKDGNTLPRYDKWGSTYYYYSLEKTQWEDGISRQNFPESAVVYEDNDFNINNVFSAEPPYVEIAVEKIWELSDDVLAKLNEYGLSDISTDDFAPATISLYGIPTDSHQAEIDKSLFDFGSVTLKPGVKDSDGDGTDDTVYTVDDRELKATYTFKSFYNDETAQEERLPYYWLHNYVINYYLKETHNNGYMEDFSTAKVNLDGSRSENNLIIRYNSEKFGIKNTYSGIDSTTIDFNFSKVWNDKYVNNDEYRPDEVIFTIKRSLGGKVDDGFAKTVTLKKSDFINQNTWTGTLENLLKYGPSGEEYVYFVDSEKAGDTVADAVGEEMGAYILTSKSNDRLINTLNDNLRITLEAEKAWTVDGVTVNSYTNGSFTGFDDLRDMGVIPDSIQFVVQRKVAGGSYDYVPASSYPDNVHETIVDNQNMVGHEVNLKDAYESNYSQMLNAAMKWENLPKYDSNGHEYSYRVIEILHWHDGTTDKLLTSESISRGMTASIEPGTEANVFRLTNNLLTDRVRIAKIWVDENGDENTRPATITVKFNPVGDAEGRELTLTTTGNAMDKADANVYYSAYFHIPKGVAKTYGVTGEKYTITESFTAPNGANYTKTITSDNGNVVTMADGTYVLQLTNTYVPPATGRKTLDLEATKKWSGDSAWKDVTRPNISFKVQYYNRDTKEWTDITDMSAFSKDAAQDVTKTVPADGKVTWTNMYKYWHPVTVDGKAEFIRYRVVEVVNTDSTKSSYSKDSPEFTGITDSTAIAKATLTNTLQTKTVKVNKSWIKNGNASDKLTSDEVKKLVALNAIPNELTFAIEYRLADTSTWTTIPNGTVTYTAEALLSTQNTGKKLPQYDSQGREISYRVRETKVKYLNGSNHDVTWSGNTGEIGSIFTTPQSITYADHTAAMINDYQYVSMAISKLWVDEGNRDGLRGDISVTLSRDGESYSVVTTANGNVSQTNSFCTVVKDGDNWALRWDYLPKYQAGEVPSDSTKSVYTWAETGGVNGYDATYDADGADRSKAENTYQPMRGTVTATKTWSDNSNKFNSMSDEIYLKLQYKIGTGTWYDVEQNTLETVNGKQLYKNSSADKAYTTDADGWRTAAADNNWSLSWADLPVKAQSGTNVTYRVVEGVKGADGGITVVENRGKLNGYTVTYSNNVTLSANQNSNFKVTNTLDTTTLKISKNWAGESTYTDKVRPQSVTFNVEWKKGTDDWKPIPSGVSDKLTIADGKSTVTVNADGNWSETISDLPKADADGVAYQYRITEAKITYADGDVTVNSQQKIAGPYNVTNVTVDAVLSNGAYAATAENRLLTGKLTVTKKWTDGNDRDGGRKSIDVVLYRDGVEFDSCTLTANNTWTYTWQNLPVRVNNAANAVDYAKYTVKEIGEDGNAYTGNNDIAYTVRYGGETTVELDRDTEIENSHTPLLLDLTAGKDWGNDQDKINVRPDSVQFKLQYRISGGNEWIDLPTANVLGANSVSMLTGKDSEQVYMASDDTVTQELSDSNNWTAAWHNLTANVRMGSETKQVQYRVVELTEAIRNYMPVNDGVSAEVNYSSQNKSVTISNQLMRGSLTVNKAFTVNGQTVDGDTLYRLVKTMKILPENLTVTLSYRDGTETKIEKKTISFNENTKSYTSCTFTDLPVADANGEKIVYTVTDSAQGYAFVECGTVDDVTVSNGITTQTTVTNNYAAGSLSVTKKWVDENDRDDGRQPITAQLYRDGVMIEEQVLNSGNQWCYIWRNLPVYQNNSETDKSVYTVKEKGEQDGIYTGRNNIIYSVAYSDGVTLEQTAEGTTSGYAAEAIITNTHQVFVGTLTVGKTWNDSENKFGSRPANITLTLQYQESDGSWVDVGTTDDVYTDSTNPGIISNTVTSYNWSGLPVNLNGHSITYRVVETAVSGYCAAVYQPATVQLTKTNDVYAGTVNVTNELDTTSLTIHKDWECVSYLTPSAADFRIEYKHGDSGWLVYDDTVTVTYSADTNGGQVVVSGLPKTDGQGDAYSYRVREESTKYYVGDKDVTFSAYGSFDEVDAWSGNAGIYFATVRGCANEDGSFIFNANNEVLKGNLTVTKNWTDDNDRDAGRQSVTVELYRDGEKFDEKTLSADEEWTAMFTDLPVYRNIPVGDMSEKSVYTLKEKNLNEAGQYVGNNERLYDVSYVDGVSLEANADNTYSAQASLTNTHEPLNFSVKAMKAWEDTKDYGIRPDVQLELRWATSVDATNWMPVVQSVSAPKDGTGKTVTTTSPVRQTLKNEDQDIGTTWGSAQWNDLPAYVIAVVDGAEISTPVYYKVFEVGEIPAAYESAESATTSYANAQGDDMIATVQVVNTLAGKMSVNVQKTWLDDSEKYNDHADSITVKLQYVTSDIDTEWKDIPVDATQVLSAESIIPWSYTWENLRNDYRYRVIELSMTFGDVTHEVQPSDGTEGEIGGYTYTAETTVNADGTLTQCDITNELIVGKIEVTKTWEDCHNRDGMRPETLTFQLYRDDGTEPIAIKEVNVTADGIEECVFENIPIYREGTRELSRYYVVEIDEEGYSITYDATVDSAVSLSSEMSDVTTVTDQTTHVTNRHETILFRVEATKTWDDANDPYGLRPTEVSLKLQYAFDPKSEEWNDVTVVTAVPDPAEDEGTLVFTTSQLIQILKSEDLLEKDGNVWGTAAWENLPAYALVPAADGQYLSMPVYYRVVETESVADSYGSYAAEPMCYEDIEGDDLTATGTVTNPLEDRTELKVTKKWIGGKLDVQILAQLQYRADENSEWTPIPKNAEVKLSNDNEWTYTFTDLRADYQYRCVELGMICSGKLTEIRQVSDKDTVVYGFLSSYSATAATDTITDELGHTYYVTELTNRYIPDPDKKEDQTNPTDPTIPQTGDNSNMFMWIALMFASGGALIGTAAYRRKKRYNGNI